MRTYGVCHCTADGDHRPEDQDGGTTSSWFQLRHSLQSPPARASVSPQQVSHHPRAGHLPLLLLVAKVHLALKGPWITQILLQG